MRRAERIPQGKYAACGIHVSFHILSVVYADTKLNTAIGVFIFYN